MVYVSRTLWRASAKRKRECELATVTIDESGADMPQTQTPEAEALDLRNYHPLGRLRWFIRGYVFFEGLLMALICACLWFWFTFTLDFSLNYFFDVDLLDHASWVRTVLAVGFGALLAFFLVWYIARRIFREF